MSEFAFKVLLLFFPGVLCAFLVDHLTIHRRRDPFFFLLHAFVLGLISYFLYWLGLSLAHLIWPHKVSPSVNFLKSLTDTGTTFCFQEIAWVAGVSILLALIIAPLYRFKILHRTASLLNLTTKFGDLDVWGYMLNMKAVVWVTVRDHKNDLVFDGWVQAFSDDSKDAELLLRDVSLYRNSTGERLYQVGALYLSRKREDISIECRTIPIDERVKWQEDEHE